MNNDTLKLNVSKSFTLANNNEENINLNLTTPSINTKGNVTGTV